MGQLGRPSSRKFLTCSGDELTINFLFGASSGKSLLNVTNLHMPSAVEHLFDAPGEVVAPKLVDGGTSACCGSSRLGVGHVACCARGEYSSLPDVPAVATTCMPLYSVIAWIVFMKQAKMSLVGGVTQ